MNPIYQIDNQDNGHGTVINLAALQFVGVIHPSTRHSRRYFNVTVSGNERLVESGGKHDIEVHREHLITAWQEYNNMATSTSTKRHQHHRIEKGDNHALIDLHEVLYVGAVMELNDNKYGFPIILRSTGLPINVSFDRESEASRAHVALDNAYGDYLDNLNQQGV